MNLDELDWSTNTVCHPPIRGLPSAWK